MKRIILSIFILTSIATMNVLAQAPDVSPGKINYLDFKNGFKGITLGTEITTIASKVKFLQDSDSGTKYYDFLDMSDNKVGEAIIERMTLVVYSGRIKDIFIQIKKGDGLTLYSILREAYGMYSDKPNRYLDKYYWNGEAVRLIFDFESEFKSPNLWFSSIPLSKEYNKVVESNNKKATGQL